MSADRRGRARTPAFLAGKRLWLRPLELEDARGPYLRWLNDPETTRFLETGRFPTTRAALEETVRSVKRDPLAVMLAIVERRTGSHIGNIKLGSIDPIHRCASLGLLVGDPRCRGRGYGTEAVALMCEYGFQRLNLHKITAGIYADHAASRRIFERAGFTTEGVLRQQLFRDGCYHDKVVVGLLREEFLACHTLRR